MRLQPVALERGLPEPEAAAALTFRDSSAETLFDNGLHGCLLSVCQLSHFFKKAVWYLYGYLHLANHIKLYGKMSRYSCVRYSCVKSVDGKMKVSSIECRGKNVEE